MHFAFVELKYHICYTFLKILQVSGVEILSGGIIKLQVSEAEVNNISLRFLDKTYATELGYFHSRLCHFGQKHFMTLFIHCLFSEVSLLLEKQGLKLYSGNLQQRMGRYFYAFHSF